MTLSLFLHSLVTRFARWLLRVNGDLIVVLPHKYQELSPKIHALMLAEEVVSKLDVKQGTKPQPGWMRQRKVADRVMMALGTQMKLERSLVNLTIECLLQMYGVSQAEVKDEEQEDKAATIKRIKEERAREKEAAALAASTSNSDSSDSGVK